MSFSYIGQSKRPPNATWVRVLCCALHALSLAFFASSLTAQDQNSTKYSPEVVAKAEKILEGFQLRQSGKTIQSTGTTEVARAISSLAREKRELRLVYQEWKFVSDRIASTRQESQRLNAQTGELSLQLARVVPGDVSTNNRIVGLLNATSAQTKALATERERLKEQLSVKRDALDKAEAKYAETVLAIRRDYSTVREQLAASLADEKVQVALRVMRANFETPDGLTADKILAPLDKRIQQIEQEIFSESIKLEVDRGSLFVDVVVGKATTRMVVDSGATMISLPTKTAVELGISVPVDAPVMQLILADGRTIPARGVTLPRVRVGDFEAEDVDAVVLDAVASDAEPLLGMSFLGNFKFEINTSAKTLKMLRVNTD